MIRVLSMEPIVMGPPHRITSLDVIKADLARWDRKQIIYEGIYRTGFETSAVDEMWLEYRVNTEIILSSDVGQENRVRVTGILFARPGARYGHLGLFRFQLTASKIEYLGVIR